MTERIERIEIEIADVDMWQPPVDVPVVVRSEGLHQSDLVRSLAIRTGQLKPEIVKHGRRELDVSELDSDNRSVTLLWMVGRVWELYCAGMYPEIRWQSKTKTVDGIALSPDGFWTEKRWSAIWECKATWKTCRGEGEIRSISSLWLYRVQIMNYCYGFGLTRAKLHILYLMGDWGFGGNGPRPVYVVYHVGFERGELRENWAMMLREKERYGRERDERKRNRI